MVQGFTSFARIPKSHLEFSVRTFFSRKGAKAAKKTLRNAVALCGLCVFARENFSPHWRRQSPLRIIHHRNTTVDGSTRRNTWLASYNARVQSNGSQSSLAPTHPNYWITRHKLFPKSRYNFLDLTLSIVFGASRIGAPESCVHCKRSLITAGLPAPDTFPFFRWTRGSNIPPAPLLRRTRNTSIRKTSSSSLLKEAAMQSLQPLECSVWLVASTLTRFRSS